MTEARNRLPLLLGILGAGFIAYKFVHDEVENYENNLGFTVKGFKPKWTPLKPLTVTLNINVDIRNDNHIGGQVLGFDGELTWGKDGATLCELDVNPFDLKANGHINKSTWIADIPLMDVKQEVRDQIKAGNWQQLPWIKGDLQTSYGKVSGINSPMIQLD